MRASAQFVRELLLPRTVLSWFLFVPGLLSLLALARDAFKIGLSQVLQKVLVYYDWIIDWLIGWAKPLIELVLLEFGLKIDLYPHWKHVFVLFNIYLVRSASSSLRVHRPTGVFRFTTGFLIAAVVSIAAGAMPLTAASRTVNLIVVMIPVLGLFAYGVFTGLWQATFRKEVEQRRRGQTAWSEIFLGHLYASLRRTVIAFVVALVAVLSPLNDYIPSSALAVLVALVIMHALYNLRDGVSQLEREPWHGSYWNTPSAKIGLDMLRYFAYASLAISLNAGSP